MYHQKNVDYVELIWEDFIYQIDNRDYKKQEKVYNPRFTKVIIHYFLTQDKIVSWRNKIRMHTFKDDYLINTLRFISAKEESQIYGDQLPKSMTNHAMWETKAYKTYPGYATRATPPKKARKFKKPTSPQLSTVPVSIEEPTKKLNRVKRSTKKSTKAPAGGVVIRETLKIPLSKLKENVDFARGKGIELLSNVALTEEARYEEVQRKSIRDFHKTHPRVPNVIEEEPSKSEAESWGNDEDDSNNEQDSSGEDSDQENASDDDKTQLDNENDLDSKHETDENESDETKITDKAEGDEDEEMDYTTSQLYDDVDIRLNEPVDTDQGFVQEEGIDAAMTNIQQGNENPEILQVIEDAHVTLSTVPHKTKVPVTSSSHSFDLASKFLNFLDIPHSDVEVIYPMDVYVQHEVSNKDEGPSTGSDRGLKKRKTSKDAKPTKSPKAKESQSGSSKGDKSQSKSFGKSVQSEEPEFEVADSDMPQDQEENPRKDDEEPKEKVATKHDSFTKPSQPQEPIDHDWNVGKTPQQEQNQNWKHGYGYLQEIVVKRADNDLYRFKEGDFPCLHINDIEDMLLLVVQNRLSNLLGDDVSDFAIALRMFTRSLVIQKRDEDLQLKVKSYLKKINITKPETTKSRIKKRDPYNLYQDPQGFIYVDNSGRNRLMRSDELYKFSDGTLRRLGTSLGDITKNIRMEYLPKSRWSTLEKKRANIMIKAIDNQLKERRMIRSL
uniref:Uncharacterized protein n=1 Tax=Tanacetum cinerariifolium TaxID=118510 RepID=A0A699HQU4_TANCI|nr:hypothetical protein [Tanacetum cinerariifolium]